MMYYRLDEYYDYACIIVHLSIADDLVAFGATHATTRLSAPAASLLHGHAHRGAADGARARPRCAIGAARRGPPGPDRTAPRPAAAAHAVELTRESPPGMCCCDLA